MTDGPAGRPQQSYAGPSTGGPKLIDAELNRSVSGQDPSRTRPQDSPCARYPSTDNATAKFHNWAGENGCAVDHRGRVSNGIREAYAVAT